MSAVEAGFGRRTDAGSAGGGMSLPRTGLPVVVVLYLICVVLPIAFYAGPIFMTTLRMMTLALVIPLTVNLLMGKYGRIIPTDYLFFAHLGWAGIALWVNNPDQVVQQIGSVGIEFLGGYLIGRAYIRTPESFAALCRMLMLLVLFSIPFAIYEANTGRPIIVDYLRRLPGLTSVAMVDIDKRMNLERVQWTFAHPIHYGLFCSVAFSLVYVALQGLMSDAKRIVASLMILCSGLLALSSGALLAMVMQLGLISWYTLFRNVANRWKILVGLTAFCYVTVDLISNRTAIQVFLSYATFSPHNAYWRMIIFDWGLDNIIGNAERGIPGSPWFGIGLNSWIRPHFMHSGSMDNFWLVMGVRYGIPGFALLAAGYIYVIAKVMRRDFSASLVLTRFRRAWVFTFLGLTFTLSTVHVWTNIYSFVTFMFGAGVWFIAAEASRDAPDDNAGEDRGPRRSGPVYTRFPDGDATQGHARGVAPAPRNRS